MTTFNQMRIDALSSVIEWEGLKIYGGIEITDLPKKFIIRFTSPHPAGEVALRVRAIKCKVILPEGKLSTDTRMVHGDVNPGFKPGDENYGDFEITKVKEGAKIFIYNEYLVGPRAGVTTSVLEAFSGDSGVLVEREDTIIRFRCNSWWPEDRKAFRDLVGTVELIY